MAIFLLKNNFTGKKNCQNDQSPQAADNQASLCPSDLDYVNKIIMMPSRLVTQSSGNNNGPLHAGHDVLAASILEITAPPSLQRTYFPGSIVFCCASRICAPLAVPDLCAKLWCLTDSLFPTRWPNLLLYHFRANGQSNVH